MFRCRPRRRTRVPARPIKVETFLPNPFFLALFLSFHRRTTDKRRLRGVEERERPRERGCDGSGHARSVGGASCRARGVGSEARRAPLSSPTAVLRGFGLRLSACVRTGAPDEARPRATVRSASRAPVRGLTPPGASRRNPHPFFLRDPRTQRPSFPWKWGSRRSSRRVPFSDLDGSSPLSRKGGRGKRGRSGSFSANRRAKTKLGASVNGLEGDRGEARATSPTPTLTRSEPPPPPRQPPAKRRWAPRRTSDVERERTRPRAPAHAGVRSGCSSSPCTSRGKQPSTRDLPWPVSRTLKGWAGSLGTPFPLTYHPTLYSRDLSRPGVCSRGEGRRPTRLGFGV